MYCVYSWDDDGAKADMYDELGNALNGAEKLRNKGRRFVTLVSENPNSVGKPGVDVTGPDYNWTKRRNT